MLVDSIAEANWRKIAMRAYHQWRSKELHHLDKQLLLETELSTRQANMAALIIQIKDPIVEPTQIVTDHLELTLVLNLSKKRSFS